MAFDTFLKFLSGNPYLNIIFLILAIASVLTTIFFYFKSKRYKDPRYFVKIFTIIDENISTIDGLKISYNEKSVDRLSICKIAFWNNGNETIEGSNIAPADKLRVRLASEGNIINAKIISSKKEANSFCVKLVDNEILVNFDFIDQGDGVVFEFYFSAPEKTDIEFAGTIKGVKSIRYGTYHEDFLSDKIFPKLFGWVDRVAKPNEPLFYMLLILFFPIYAPIFIISQLFSKLGMHFSKTPKEYDLAEQEGDSLIPKE